MWRLRQALGRLLERRSRSDEGAQELGQARALVAELAGAWTNGRHEVRLELRPVNPQGAAPMRAAGSLQRVELELGRGRHSVRARVSRQPDHLLATADWDGAEIARRVGRRDRFEEAPYVTEALDRLGHDRIFEEAVRHAARLVPR